MENLKTSNWSLHCTVGNRTFPITSSSNNIVIKESDPYTRSFMVILGARSIVPFCVVGGVPQLSGEGSIHNA